MRTAQSKSLRAVLPVAALLVIGLLARPVQADLGNGSFPNPGGAVQGPLGPVTVGGPWFEFGFSGAGVPATGCFPADPGGPGCSPSSGGNSVFADAPPWTFTAGPAGAILTVTDAFLLGDVFDVFDFGLPIGGTSVPGGGDCGDDPAVCVTDPNASSGVFPLGPGAHSITITPSASPFGGGAAYFRVDGQPGAVAPMLSPWGLLGAVLVLGSWGAVSLRRRTRKRDAR